MTLERNYRSTQAILSASNAVIDLAAERFTKNLWTERATGQRPRLVNVKDEIIQANYIVDQILENREGRSALKQQAVLFRTSSHSGPLEVELTRRDIPFVKFGGLKSLDAAHVKVLLAILRFAEKSRPDRNAFGSATLATSVVASAGPTPGNSSSRRHVSFERCQAFSCRSNSRICSSSLPSCAPKSS